MRLLGRVRGALRAPSRTGGPTMIPRFHVARKALYSKRCSPSNIVHQRRTNAEIPGLPSEHCHCFSLVWLWVTGDYSSLGSCTFLLADDGVEDLAVPPHLITQRLTKLLPCSSHRYPGFKFLVTHFST